MSRSLTRKDFLVLGAASAGTALTVACGDDATSGTGSGGTGGGSTGGTGTAGTGTSGMPASGGSSSGSSSGGKASGGTAGTASGGAGGQSGGTGGAGGGGGTGGASGNSCAANVVAEISCPHPVAHALTVPMADIMAGVDKMYDIKGASTHSHMLTLTAADFTTLKSGGTVFKFTPSDNQPHCVTLSCGVAGDPEAAPVCMVEGGKAFSCN